ncbi:unnamed protein product [Cyclocybe aegerita]|uniref:Uncharacterized protein n=1 Tax=Cyclocybe aegerita TaxID=1973307 RepID=A0A8S0XFC6_CYCAE|nr:unnamed protein product [Cyclocybe aegerita]
MVSPTRDATCDVHAATSVTPQQRDFSSTRTTRKPLRFHFQNGKSPGFKMGFEYSTKRRRSSKQKENTARALQIAQARRRGGQISPEATSQKHFSVILSPDLLRQILELVVDEHGRKYGPKLLLVSRSAYEWIRPMLYRVIVQFVNPHFESPTETNLPPSSVDVKLEDVGKFAEHLLVGGSRNAEEVNRILEASPNVFNLAIWSEKSLRRFLPHLRRLSPRQLSANIDSMDPEDFQGPAFSNLTHLDVVGWNDEPWSTWKQLVTLPKLTHLSINCPVASQVVLDLLSECKHLQVLVILKRGSDWLEMKCLQPNAYENAYKTIDDHRLVLLDQTPAGDVSQDWINGARGEMNVWTFAEKISYARKHKMFSDCSQRSFSAKPWDSMQATFGTGLRMM